MAQTFSRADFYHLVWTKPVSHLARDLRLSDVAIHKICRKHDIPTPPPGWWAKKQAGRDVEKTPLPEPGNAASHVNISTPEICSELEVLTKAREAARVTASTTTPNRSITTDPIVEATIAALRSAQPSRKGLVSVSSSNLISCEVTPASITRLETILRRLVAAAEDQGFVLQENTHCPNFVGHGQSISIRVAETFRRVKHVRTAAEQAAISAWEKRRLRKRNWGWNDPDPYPHIPDWDYLFSDQLSIELSSVYIAEERSPRSTWRDGKAQRLDKIAPDIAVGMVVLAAAKTEAARLSKEAEARRRQAQLERERPYRLAYISERRSGGLDSILDDMVKLANFRQLIGQLRSSYSTDADHPRVAEFLRWSEDELKARETKLSPEGLECRFDNQNLFGNDDDHDFAAARNTWR